MRNPISQTVFEIIGHHMLQTLAAPNFTTRRGIESRLGR